MTSALDTALLAADERDGLLRRERYRLVLKLAGDAVAGELAEDALARAIALCGLARDGDVSIQEAVAAVDWAVRRDAGCAALLTLAETYVALENPSAALETVVRVPKWCFRGPQRHWRFVLWDLRAACLMQTGRPREALTYVRKLLARITREDPDELIWVAPAKTVGQLIELARSGLPEAESAREQLRELCARVDTTEWFGAVVASGITGALAE